MFCVDPTRAILSCGEILVGTFKTEPIFEKRTHDMGHLYFYVFSIVMSWIMVRISTKPFLISTVKPISLMV